MRTVLWVSVVVGAMGCTTGLIEGNAVEGEDRDGPPAGSGSGSGSGEPEPAPADCKEALAFYGVTFTDGPANPGVATPVTATLPIRGIGYRYNGSETPRETLYGDCTLIRSLAEAAPILAANNVVQVVDIGVYNYRCIGGGAPPDCPNGVSQHAYATAIDIAGLTDAAGTYYSVNDDWVIDPDAEDTCSAPTVEGKDRFLHEVICALKAADVWTIVLTPNYNAAHRNHFHVDLSPNSDFIERRFDDHAD